jgi:hypothetical protein
VDAVQWDDGGAGNKKPSVVALRESDVEAGRCLGRRQAATRQWCWGNGTCAQIEGAQADLDNLNPTSSLTDYIDYAEYGGGESEARQREMARGGGAMSGGVVACSSMGILFRPAWAVERVTRTQRLR